jgi:hypothetical protein
MADSFMAIVIPAEEEDFFRYTTKRWLWVSFSALTNIIGRFNPCSSFNEAYEMSRRYVRFNVGGLFQTAVDLVGNGATKCISSPGWLQCSRTATAHSSSLKVSTL